MTKLYLGDANGRDGKDMSAVGAHVLKIYLGAETNAKLGGGQDMRAVGSHVHRLSRPLRLLLSYHYYKDEDVAELLKTCFDGIELDIFADSGAYSAMTCGTSIDPDAYIAWIERWKGCFQAVAGPDVIGDPVATARETQRMLERVTGVPVLPTFHVGEDWKWLRHWVDRVGYLALGGMVPYTRTRKLLDAWLTKAFSMIRPEVKVHGFGLTTWPLLLKYPWFSVDSSSWTACFRYAQLQLFDGRRFQKIKMGDRRSLLGAVKVLAQYGLRPPDVQAASYDRDLLVGVSVESWQRAEEYLASRRVFLSAGSLPAGGHGNGHDVAVANGLRCYLSAGSEKIAGAPNTPDGLARGIARQSARTDAKVYLSIGASGPGAGNWPEDLGRALIKKETP